MTKKISPKLEAEIIKAYLSRFTFLTFIEIVEIDGVYFLNELSKFGKSHRVNSSMSSLSREGLLEKMFQEIRWELYKNRKEKIDDQS